MGYHGFTMVFHLRSWICLKFSQSKSGVGLDAWKAHVRVICRVLTCLDVLTEKTHNGPTMKNLTLWIPLVISLRLWKNTLYNNQWVNKHK